MFMLSVVISVLVLMEICNNSTQQRCLDPFGDITIPQRFKPSFSPVYLESFALAVSHSAAECWMHLLDQANKKKSLSCNWFESSRKRLRALGEIPPHKEFACSYSCCRKCQIAAVPCSSLDCSCFFSSMSRSVF